MTLPALPVFPAVCDVVPHSGRMLLLDRITAAGAGALTAEVTIRADTLFAQGHGVGAWIGIEYMAQAIAAFAGLDALARGEKAKIGFLVGTRRYVCNVSYFPLGATLQITVRRDPQGDDHLGSFVCSITGAGIMAEAAVTVFQPDDSTLMIGGVHA